jgi:uncharacterized protein (DUF1330 family)
MFYVTVNLYGRNGIRGEFREYESKALALFRKHGGEVLAAYTPLPEGHAGETPDEIHMLRIKSRADFQAFMDDPERIKLGEERAAVIRKTEVFLSGENVAYGP